MCNISQVSKHSLKCTEIISACGYPTLPYKSTIPKYDFNNTQFVGLNGQQKCRLYEFCPQLFVSVNSSQQRCDVFLEVGAEFLVIILSFLA